jgi:hypothetical protein
MANPPIPGPSQNWCPHTPRLPLAGTIRSICTARFTGSAIPLSAVPRVLHGRPHRHPLGDGPNRAYYQRKRAEGRGHHQALIALARRRVDVLWALLRDNRHFELQPPPRPS